MQYVIKRIKNSILPTICLSFVLAYSPDVSLLALVCLTYKKTKKNGDRKTIMENKRK